MLVVAKYRGSDGALLWRTGSPGLGRTVAETANLYSAPVRDYGAAWAEVVTASGTSVYVGGRAIVGTTAASDAVVAAYDADGGTRQWVTTYEDDQTRTAEYGDRPVALAAYAGGVRVAVSATRDDGTVRGALVAYAS